MIDWLKRNLRRPRHRQMARPAASGDSTGTALAQEFLDALYRGDRVIIETREPMFLPDTLRADAVTVHNALLDWMRGERDAAARLAVEQRSHTIRRPIEERDLWKRLAQLHETQRTAGNWGGAYAAREEEIRGITAKLHSMGKGEGA